MQLEQANYKISYENKLLYDKNCFLAKINDEFDKKMMNYGRELINFQNISC